MAHPWTQSFPFEIVYDYSYDAIMRSYEASLQRLRALDDERLIAWVQALRGEVAIEGDRLDEAEVLVRESLAARERLGFAMFVAECELLQRVWPRVAKQCANWRDVQRLAAQQRWIARAR